MRPMRTCDLLVIVAKLGLPAGFQPLGIAAGPALGAGPERSRHQGETKERPSNGGDAPTGSSSRASQSGIASPVTATASTSAPAASANRRDLLRIVARRCLDRAARRCVGRAFHRLLERPQGSRQIDAPVASTAVGIAPPRARRWELLVLPLPGCRWPLGSRGRQHDALRKISSIAIR